MAEISISFVVFLGFFRDFFDHLESLFDVSFCGGSLGSFEHLMEHFFGGPCRVLAQQYSDRSGSAMTRFEAVLVVLDSHSV